MMYSSIDIEFYSKDKKALKKMRDDFEKICLENEDEAVVTGTAFLKAYFPTLRGDFAVVDSAIFDVFQSYDAGKKKSDRFSEIRVQDDGDNMFSTLLVDASNGVPVLFAAIAEKYYPKVRMGYASIPDDDSGREDPYLSYDPKGSVNLTEGQRYHAVIYKTRRKEDISGDTTILDEESFDCMSFDEADKRREEEGFTGMVVSEWRVAPPEDEIFAFDDNGHATKLKDFDLKSLPAQDIDDNGKGGM